MASYTTNLNLKKPAGSENVAIGDINGNMDTIDTAYGALNSKIDNLLKSKTLTNTTDSDGLVSLGMQSSDYAVVAVVDNDSSKKNIYVPFKYLGIWHVRVTSPTGVTVASTSCNMKIYYFE